MKVKLTLNIGTRDANKYGIKADPDKLREGETLDMDEATAKVFIDKGWAVKPGDVPPQQADDGDAAPKAGTPSPAAGKNDKK